MTETKVVELLQPPLSIAEKLAIIEAGSDPNNVEFISFREAGERLVKLYGTNGLEGMVLFNGWTKFSDLGTKREGKEDKPNALNFYGPDSSTSLEKKLLSIQGYEGGLFVFSPTEYSHPFRSSISLLRYPLSILSLGEINERSLKLSWRQNENSKLINEYELIIPGIRRSSNVSTAHTQVVYLKGLDENQRVENFWQNVSNQTGVVISDAVEVVQPHIRYAKLKSGIHLRIQTSPTEYHIEVMPPYDNDNPIARKLVVELTSIVDDDKYLILPIIKKALFEIPRRDEGRQPSDYFKYGIYMDSAAWSVGEAHGHHVVALHDPNSRPKVTATIKRGYGFYAVEVIKTLKELKIDYKSIKASLTSK